MELEITWGRTIQVWWAYVWRNLIAILVAMIVGMGVGAIIGFVMGTIGCSMNAIQIVTGLIGFVIGVVISVFPMKMILGKDFWEFRLVLLSAKTLDGRNSPSAPH